MSLKGLKQARQVPASCCKKTASDPNSDECVYHPDSENAYLTGCLTQVWSIRNLLPKSFSNS